MHNFPRPAAPTLDAIREPRAGACPSCGRESLAAYRVMSEGGWWDVIKCQACLHSVERRPGPLLGAFVPLGAPAGLRPKGDGRR